MKTLTQPAGKPAGIIRKYYPNLGEHLPSPTWPALAAEWYSTLTRVGTEGLDWYVFSRNERASDKEEFRACVAMLLAEIEQHAHLPGYSYGGHYPPADLTPQRVAELDSNGQAALRAVREWHTFFMLSPIEQFLYRARKIELWQNEQQQLATREARHEEWGEEYAVQLLALRRAIPTAKKRLLRVAYTELNQLLPTLQAGRPLEWQRLYDGGHPFFSSALTATYTYSEFNPLRPTRDTTNQITEPFFQYLHVHLFEKEWHVWQALILLAGALGEAAPPTPETFQEKQVPAVTPVPPLDTPAFTVIKSQAQVLSEMIAQIAADAEASANAQGFTLGGKPGNPVPPAPATTETPQPGSPHPAVAPSEALTQLLLNYSLAELRTLLTDLGLLDKGTGQASPAASPGAWVGIIHALIDEQRPRLRGSKAAIWRAFSRTFGAVVSERSVQYGLGTNQSEAEQFRDRALSLLKA